ncbi:hypothetical protein [Staphylococcus phage vB_SauH_DELF3]|nr:hypothetical protein [Staphylococcus phage vB_SauH_DELF3]
MANLIDRNITSTNDAFRRAYTNDVLTPRNSDGATRFKKGRDTQEAIIVEEAGFPYNGPSLFYNEREDSRDPTGYFLVRYNDAS